MPSSHAEDLAAKTGASTVSPRPAQALSITAVGVPNYASMEIRKDLSTADFYYPDSYLARPPGAVALLPGTPKEPCEFTS